MNKLLTFIILITLTTVFAFGQSNPTCNDLVVENLEMDNDSTMKVTIRNNCSNCSSAGYCDVIVIQNSIDTIANTNSPSFFTPDNDSSQVYFLYSTVTTIPPINQLTISMPCVCNTIPLSPTLGINENKKKENVIKVYPNPAKENIKIETEKGVIIKTIQLNNITGKLIKTFPVTDKILNIAGIAEGQYVLIISTNKGTFTEKIIKQQ